MIASMNTKIDRCERHSQRWWHLVIRKWKRIKKIDDQIRDGLHKHTTNTPPEIMIVVEQRAPTLPAWDVNMDGITNATDVQLVTEALGQRPPKTHVPMLMAMGLWMAKTSRSWLNTLAKRHPLRPRRCVPMRQRYCTITRIRSTQRLGYPITS